MTNNTNDTITITDLYRWFSSVGLKEHNLEIGRDFDEFVVRDYDVRPIWTSALRTATLISEALDFDVEFTKVETNEDHYTLRFRFIENDPDEDPIEEFLFWWAAIRYGNA